MVINMLKDCLSNPNALKILTVLPFEWDTAFETASARPFNALSFRLKGNCEFSYSSGLCKAKSYDIVFVPEGVSYCVNHKSEVLIAVHFKIDDIKLCDIEVFSPAEPAMFSKLFEEILDVWSKKDAGFELKAQSVFLDILYKLVKNDLPKAVSEAERIAEKASEIIRLEFRNSNLSIDSVCSRVGASGTYLRRVFWEYYKMTPIAYLSQLRYKYATELLESNYFTVSKVAEMCGFSDAKYFSRFMKRFSGFPPSKIMHKK